MANMGFRVYGPEIRRAIEAWVRQHVTNVKNVQVDTKMTLDGFNRTIGTGQESWIYVEFDSEKAV